MFALLFLICFVSLAIPTTGQFLSGFGPTFCGDSICGPCQDCVPYFPSCVTSWCPHHCQVKICPIPRTVCQVVGGIGQCLKKNQRLWNAGTSAFKILDLFNGVSNEIRPPLIPRAVLYLAPDRTAVQLSPDGKFIGFVAPVNRIPNILVQPVEDAIKGLNTFAPVTFVKTPPGIRVFSWTYSPGVLLYTQDNQGDENERLYKVDAFTKQQTLLAGQDGAQVKIVCTDHNYKHLMIVGINNRNKTVFDLYRLNITSGESSIYFINEFGFSSFEFDENMNLQLASIQSEEGGPEFYRTRQDPWTKRWTWELYKKVSFDEELTTKPLTFDISNKYLYWSDSTLSDKTRLIKTDFETQRIVSVIYEPTKSDMGPVLWHPVTHKPLAVSDDYSKPRWIILDKSVREDIQKLEELDPDSYPLIQGSSVDFTKWLIMQVHDNQVQKFYLYDRISKTLNFLFTVNRAITKYKLAKMHSIEVLTQDGLTEVCYLSLPPESDISGNGRPNKPLPMILKVHGGPWLRDLWGFNQDTQLWANRGYAVLQCNFRSSTGYGKNFINAGNGEWGKKMQTDLLDAVDWAVREGVADSEKIAIYGASYGGYAALAGLSFSPEKFACGVDVVGPSNLVTLMKAIPPTWRPYYNSMKKRIGGDPDTLEGKRFLQSRSPLFYATNIKKPLLIAQGANDPRVKKRESDQIFEAVSDKKIPITYLVFPDEGHGFSQGQNKLAHLTVAEEFLADCLGGRAEPRSADSFGTSMQIHEGKNNWLLRLRARLRH